MTYELLLALLLALSPYLGKHPGPSEKSVYDLNAQEAVQQAKSTCRALLQSPEISLFGVPLGQFIDEMIGSVSVDQVAGIFAEDFQPKLSKLGLDYNEAINFYLSICHKAPSEAYRPDEKRINAAVDILAKTRKEILAYLGKQPLGAHPGSENNPYATVFRLRDGDVVYDSKRMANSSWIPLDKIPLLLQQALIAVEDKQFYNHRGIDISSLIRAANKSLEGDFQGGSTITQQLVKNLYYFNRKDPDETQDNPRLRRKLGELITARELEQTWGKKAILEAYFNTVNFGRGAKGVGAAAELLYGKPLAKLGLAEFATLAAMPKRPGAMAYKKHFNQLQERQQYVLKQMAQEGYIKQKDVEANFLTEFPFIINTTSRTISPYSHYIRAAQKDPWYISYQKHHAIDGTLALHPGFQELAKTALLNGLLRYERTFTGRQDKEGVPIVQGAVVIMDNHSGDVLALQGGTPFVYQNGAIVPNEFDRATREFRQPGSTMKPFTYLMALESGLSPNTPVPDYSLQLPLLSEYGVPWRLSNYSGAKGGAHSLRFGLEQSRNLMTAWLLELSPLASYDYSNTPNSGKTLDEVRRLSVEFGIYCSTQEEQDGLCPKPLAAPKRHYPFILGAQETSLIRMVTAYARIANGGKAVHPQFIKHFHLQPEGDAKRALSFGNPLNQDAHLRALPVDPRSLFQLKSILVGVAQRGTAARLAKYGSRVAGKTGTSDNFRDAWFVGFTSSITIGVWVGYVDQRSLGEKASGSQVALPIFDEIAGAILDGSAQRNYLDHFPVYSQHEPLLTSPPAGLVAMAIDPKSGCIQETVTPNSLFEYFKEENVYSQTNDYCNQGYPSPDDGLHETASSAEPMANPDEFSYASPGTAQPWIKRRDGHFGSSSWIMDD